MRFTKKSKGIMIADVDANKDKASYRIVIYNLAQTFSKMKKESTMKKVHLSLFKKVQHDQAEEGLKSDKKR